MRCTIDIFVPDTGERVAFIYSDSAIFLKEIGFSTDIKRVSHVEPTADGKWTADMSPVGGPVLGPFERRDSALKAEVKWLVTHLKKGGAA